MVILHPKILEQNGEKQFAVIPYEEFLKIQEELSNYEDLSVRSAFGGANAGVEEQRFGHLSRGEQIVGTDNIFNVLLNSGIILKEIK